MSFLDICGDIQKVSNRWIAKYNFSAYIKIMEGDLIPTYIIIEGLNQISCKTAAIISEIPAMWPVQLANYFQNGIIRATRDLYLETEQSRQINNFFVMKSCIKNSNDVIQAHANIVVTKRR